MQRNLLLSMILIAAGFSAIMAAPPAGTSKETTAQEKHQDEVIPLFLKIDSGLQPQFQGRAMPAFKRWVLQNLRFPAEGYAAGQTGNVMISFTVTKKGKLTGVAVMPGSDKTVASYVAKLVSQSPAWTAAQHEGKPVASKHILGFDIELKAAEGTAGFYSEDNTAYNIVDTMPVFGNGDAGAFECWVKERVEKYFGGDTAILKGTVPLEFVIEKDGSLAELIIGKTPNIELAKVTGKIALMAPAWTPGILFGEKVRVGMNVPIYFRDSPEPDANAIYELVDMMPQFYNGGLELFRNWVKKHVIYPALALRNNIKGRVSVEFIVEKDGSITITQILESPHQCLTDEVVRALRSAPKWVPGVSKGEVVRVIYTLPIDFRFKEEPLPQLENTWPRSTFEVRDTPTRRY